MTDANLVLGYLSGDSPLAGGVRLDRAAAERVIGELAGRLDLAVLECAEGIIRVANAEMLRALRVVTVQRGIDPRGYALLAFGGAGPLHAAAIADELGIGTILCPRASGVLAALGLVVSPRRRDVQRSVFLADDELTADAIAALTSELGAQAREQLDDASAELSAVYELRYRGQAFELSVSADLAPAPERLREDFEAQHEERYGYHDPEQALELVTLRVSATVAAADLALGGAGEQEAARGRREARLAGETVELEVLTGSPRDGDELSGPAVLELPESTLLVPPGWTARVDADGTVRVSS